MHELAVAQGIVDIVAEEARAQRFVRAKRVRVRVGALAHVEPEALAFGFEVVSRGTPAEGAVLDVDRPPGEGWCLACDLRVTLARRGDGCPACGSFQVMVTDGEDLCVTELEVE